MYKILLEDLFGQINVLQKQKIFLSTLLDSIADNFVFQNKTIWVGLFDYLFVLDFSLTK